MISWTKRIDHLILERFDRAGFYLQTKHDWHIVDIWKVGHCCVLALMTTVSLTVDIAPRIFIIVPYAIMWGYFVAIALPWLTRQKHDWTLDRIGWWVGWVDRLRVTLFPLRLVVFCIVILLAFGPSAVNLIYGYPESWSRFALTFVRSVITPGGVIFSTYLMGIYPAPPAKKATDKERQGVADWLMKPAPLA